MNASSQWEYKVIRTKPSSMLKLQPDVEELEAQLNRLGRDGWELVSAVEVFGVPSPAFYLKRRV